MKLTCSTKLPEKNNNLTLCIDMCNSDAQDLLNVWVSNTMEPNQGTAY